MKLMHTTNLTLCFLCIFVSIAFFTLVERKILSYSQLRKGPNKVMFLGLFQPLSDAFKLIVKSMKMPSFSNFLFFFLSPFLSLFLMIILWLLYTSSVSFIWFFFGLLFYLCVTSSAVYPILSAGWVSNSKYAFIGSMRSLAQILSYEISFVFMIFVIFMFLLSYNIGDFKTMLWFILIMNPFWFLFWGCLLVAETNRAPFDFAEGESEIVSGFNTEYSSGGFAMIFLSEYGNILFLSLLSSLIFLGWSSNPATLFFSCILFCLLVIFIRSAFPRFRYDLLMTLAWQIFLFASFFFFLLSLFFS